MKNKEMVHLNRVIANDIYRSKRNNIIAYVTGEIGNSWTASEIESMYKERAERYNREHPDKPAIGPSEFEDADVSIQKNGWIHVLMSNICERYFSAVIEEHKLRENFNLSILYNLLARRVHYDMSRGYEVILGKEDIYIYIRVQDTTIITLLEGLKLRLKNICYN